jgi:hypothetical protein
MQINAGLQRCIRRRPASRSPRKELRSTGVPVLFATSATTIRLRGWQRQSTGFRCWPDHGAMQCLAPGCFRDTLPVQKERTAKSHFNEATQTRSWLPAFCGRDLPAQRSPDR